MLKGPTYFNPRTHPEAGPGAAQPGPGGDGPGRGSYPEAAAGSAEGRAPGGGRPRPPRHLSLSRPFSDLVYRQLKRDYRDEDLRSEGLRIFTTLDPKVQDGGRKGPEPGAWHVWKGQRGLTPGTLQGALIVTNSQNAEVQAVVGGRDPRFEGFNRALDARRPVGSLIKPVIYLTALEQPQNYTLATLLDDSPLDVKQPGAADWTPQNYDRQFRGQVPLREALVNSYNVADGQARPEPGRAPGHGQPAADSGWSGSCRSIPSSLLGANALSPLEVTQVYQTIAGGGFRTPLHAIRAVLTAEGKPLQRYPLKVEQEIEPAPLYLLTAAMQDVVREGTARRLSDYLPQDLDIAGKTGTTDDFRDSWFAGFTGDRLAVVWVGRDDNKPTGLTGAAGAMTVWGKMMAGLDPQPLILPQPDSIRQVWVDTASGLLSDRGCRDAVELPFIAGSAPTQSAPCGPRSLGKSIKGWFERIFGR